jgi:hypothetical protein
MSDEVAMVVAGGIRSNIRELEGALIRLNARASLDGVPISEISPEYAREVALCRVDFGAGGSQNRYLGSIAISRMPKAGTFL